MKKLNNDNFKLAEFDQFKNETGSHAFISHYKSEFEKQMLLKEYLNQVNKENTRLQVNALKNNK